MSNPDDAPPRKIRINPPVFYTSAALTALTLIFAVIAPDTTAALFTAVQAWITGKAGWFYVLAVAGFLVFVIFVGLSGYGRIKLGPDHSVPDYSYLSWFAMLFSAGMGIGLMFFGVAEPIMHYVTPPTGEGETIEAAREAMRITFFHWGLHAWAIYAVVALSLAYFSFRHGLPLTIRSALFPLIGDRIHGPIGHAVDIFAVLGTLFGVATSLGFGVIQVNAGFHYLFDMPVSPTTQVVLIIVITSMATTSVVLGLDTGIRRLSELNIVLAVLLLLFVLIAGPTVFLLQTFVQNTGNYMGSLMESTFNLYAYKPSGWIGGWTLFYWGWWIAWSPFVGMFIARVSRGRTIREFVGGVLLVPVGFTFMWMTVFGDTAIHMVLMDNVKGLTEAVSDNTAVALFKFFENLPFSGVASFLATALVVTFFVTSSDSGSLVVDMLTSGGQEESPVWQRIFWALTEGLIAVVLLLTGGLGALQTAAIATALPFTVALIFICWGMLKALRLDVLKRSIVREARIGPGGSQPDVPWKTRLKSIMHTPQRPAAEGFLANTIRPAFDEICEEFNQRQLPCRIEHGEDRAWIEVRHGDEVDFYYLVQLRRYEPPSFVIRDLKNRRAKALEFYRAEVHLKEGGQNYDIMGWSKDDVIHDVLDHYERHLHFLQLAR